MCVDLDLEKKEDPVGADPVGAGPGERTHTLEDTHDHHATNDSRQDRANYTTNHPLHRQPPPAPQCTNITTLMIALLHHLHQQTTNAPHSYPITNHHH
jgi:hypothetical protein